MKVKQMLKVAKNQLIGKDQQKATDALELSLRRIRDCEKTLKLAKKKHADLLEKDLEDLSDMDLMY